MIITNIYVVGIVLSTCVTPCNLNPNALRYRYDCYPSPPDEETEALRY